MPRAFSVRDQLEDFGDEQPELGLLAGGIAPAAEPSLASLTRTPILGRTEVLGMLAG